MSVRGPTVVTGPAADRLFVRERSSYIPEERGNTDDPELVDAGDHGVAESFRTGDRMPLGVDLDVLAHATAAR